MTAPNYPTIKIIVTSFSRGLRRHARSLKCISKQANCKIYEWMKQVSPTCSLQFKNVKKKRERKTWGRMVVGELPAELFKQAQDSYMDTLTTSLPSRCFSPSVQAGWESSLHTYTDTQQIGQIFKKHTKICSPFTNVLKHKLFMISCSIHLCCWKEKNDLRY